MSRYDSIKELWDVTYKSPSGSIGRHNAVEATDEEDAKVQSSWWLAAGSIYSPSDFIMIKAEKSIHNPRPLNNL